MNKEGEVEAGCSGDAGVGEMGEKTKGLAAGSESLTGEDVCTPLRRLVNSLMKQKCFLR